MIDRVSVFSNKELIDILSNKFVSVTIDQWYERRQKDTKGDFYRKIAAQGPRKDFSQTTQGMYVASASGQLLGYINHHDVDRVREMIDAALAKHVPIDSAELNPDSVDMEYDRAAPKDSLTVRVNTQVLGGYEEPGRGYRKIFQQAIARDNLWITSAEKFKLVKGVLPDSLSTRIARFHLVDNTRGEPLMWTKQEVRSVDFKLSDRIITGEFHIETEDGKRGYVGSVYGRIESEGDSLKRFDLVAEGKFWGNGPYTSAPPKGKFPIAMAFRLADGKDQADHVPPQGTKGWLGNYLQ